MFIFEQRPKFLFSVISKSFTSAKSVLSIFKCLESNWREVGENLPHRVSVITGGTYSSDTLVTTLFLTIFQVTVILLMEHEQNGDFLCCTDPALTPGKMKNKVLGQRTNFWYGIDLKNKAPSKCNKFATHVTSSKSLIFCLPSLPVSKRR